MVHRRQLAVQTWAAVRRQAVRLSGILDPLDIAVEW